MMNSRYPVALALLGLVVHSTGPTDVYAAASLPDERVPDLVTICDGGARNGEPCSLNGTFEECDSAADCDLGQICRNGYCSDCPGGRCSFANVTTGFIKGTLTVIADENVSAGGSEEDNNPTELHTCQLPDSDVGTRALTALLEVKVGGRKVMLAETYQNARDTTDHPRVTGWNDTNSFCSGGANCTFFTECVLEDSLLADAQKPTKGSVDDIDTSVFLFQRPESTMAAALRDLFGRPPDEVPILTAIPKTTGTTAYCDNDVSGRGDFGDFCPPTGGHSRLGSVARFKVALQFVQRPSLCASATTIPSSGGTFSGVTSGRSLHSNLCSASSEAPEAVFQWTPATSGTATVETCGAGTDFSTVLSVRQGTCQTQTEIVCNVDACAGGGSARASRVEPTVTAGQTYFIVVDGIAGEGAFTLTVSPPP